MENSLPKYITLTEDNIDKEHICCAFSDKKCLEGYEFKKEWLKKEFANGYVFRQVPSAYNNDYWTEENTGAYFPRARFNGGSAINQAQTRYMVDASYCRLKSVSIGYTLPKVLTQKASIEKIRIYFTGENLFTISDTPDGLDPELDNPYTYPMQRSLSVGLSLTF